MVVIVSSRCCSVISVIGSDSVGSRCCSVISVNGSNSGSISSCSVIGVNGSNSVGSRYCSVISVNGCNIGSSSGGGNSSGSGSSSTACGVRYIWKPLDTLPSDHRPILIPIHLPTEKLKEKIQFVCDFKKCDLAAFAAAVDEQ